MNWIYLLLGFFIGLYLKSMIDSITLKLAEKILMGDDEVNQAVLDHLKGKKTKWTDRLEKMQKSKEEGKKTYETN